MIHVSSSGPGRGFTFRLGPIGVAVQVARIADLRKVVTDEEVDPPSLAPATPQEQYEADVADAGRRRPR